MFDCQGYFRHCSQFSLLWEAINSDRHTNQSSSSSIFSLTSPLLPLSSIGPHTHLSPLRHLTPPPLHLLLPDRRRVKWASESVLRVDLLNYEGGVRFPAPRIPDHQILLHKILAWFCHSRASQRENSAWKTVSSITAIQKLIVKIKREIGTLKLLKHPNVVRLHEVKLTIA